MTVLLETRHPGEFLMTEANGQRSRETITIASGAGVIAPGTVLGKVTASGKYVASAVGASDGSQNPTAIPSTAPMPPAPTSTLPPSFAMPR